MRKGRFLHPVLYIFAKSKSRIFYFQSNVNLNIRSSVYLKKFVDCTFNIHDGKKLIKNTPFDLKLIFKNYEFYNFKLGNFSYNRQVLIRRKCYGLRYIFSDLKKKRGIVVQARKKKKFIFKLI